MSSYHPVLAIGPGGDVAVLDDSDVLDVEDEGPMSRLDKEALTDDAC